MKSLAICDSRLAHLDPVLREMKTEVVVAALLRLPHSCIMALQPSDSAAAWRPKFCDCGLRVPIWGHLLQGRVGLQPLQGHCLPLRALLFRLSHDRLGLAHRNRSDFCDLQSRCPSRSPEIARFPKQETAMMHCDLRVRWKVASDLRFRAAISEPKTPSCCGMSGDLAPSTRKSLAIAIVRFWCAKVGGLASGVSLRMKYLLFLSGYRVLFWKEMPVFPKSGFAWVHTKGSCNNTLLWVLRFRTSRSFEKAPCKGFSTGWGS